LLRPAFWILVIPSLWAQSEPKFSPENSRYASLERGRKVGKGEERSRIVVFAKSGQQLAIAHIWNVTPDGVQMGDTPRGCEDWGWIDKDRLFCQGSINPWTEAYLVFDASSGRELGVGLGTSFTWSPDGRRLANFGVGRETDSFDISGKTAWPPAGSKEHRWFRSELTWSPDSKRVAVIEQRRLAAGLFLIVVDGVGPPRAFPIQGVASWDEDDHGRRDLRIEWSDPEILVFSGGEAQVVRP